ncbi:hypothetical protein D918_02777 [Trichuris suis]|nr:hypothetical protein D918_02777 [Trichuris suis]
MEQYSNFSQHGVLCEPISLMATRCVYFLGTVWQHSQAHNPFPNGPVGTDHDSIVSLCRPSCARPVYDYIGQG